LRSQAYELPYNLIGARGGPGSEGSSAAPSDCKSAHPNLYLLIIGTSKYMDATKNLVFPDHDAEAMANALTSAGKAMFGEGHVHLKLLSTAGNGVELSSKENIKKAFNAFAQQATPCDALVVYFSGHGITWGTDGIKSNFYYLTKDISSERLRDDAVRNAYAISDIELVEWLNSVHALKQVLIIDACNSGKAPANLMNIGQKELNSTQAFAMGILNDRTGAMIITGSLADMVSYEASKYGQGLLTYSLLRGMTGPGLKDGRLVDVMTLFQHARDEVPKLAETIKQKQTPVIASEGDSFPIGIKDASVSIPVAEEKPVFIQSKFFVTGYFGDTLGGTGLGKYMDQYFFDQRIKGPAAKYVFYDIPNLDDGYSVRGSYTVQNGQVVLNGNLFKGEKTVGAPFEIKKANSLKDIRSEILKQVLTRISNKP
ncbi:MAG: caspase family protein, partial [Saprospiraceae bacterium]|nr:caspase family protein [Saprospiraceae bacterium]